MKEKISQKRAEMPLANVLLAKVGFYTEVSFVEKGVRFIAINNGIDSANQQDSNLTSFLNIINEWYAKDISKKIRAVMKSKGEAAEIVKRIFALCLDGYGPSQIARILKKDNDYPFSADRQGNGERAAGQSL